nr:hypothetical protein [Tanacetum cinerariifolium]
LWRQFAVNDKYLLSRATCRPGTICSQKADLGLPKLHLLVKNKKNTSLAILAIFQQHHHLLSPPQPTTTAHHHLLSPPPPPLDTTTTTRHKLSYSSLSTLHFLKFPENSFELLKLMQNSVEVLKILENKLESMKILENKLELFKLQENQPCTTIAEKHREEEDQEGNNSTKIETLTYHVLATYG